MKDKTPLRWNGNLEAQRQHNEATRTLEFLRYKREQKKTSSSSTRRPRKPKRRKYNYDDYMKSRRWFRKRKEFIQAVGDKCQDCDSIYELTVHHLNYNCIGYEKPKDVRVLCRSCHQLRHVDYMLDNELDITLSKQ